MVITGTHHITDLIIQIRVQEIHIMATDVLYPEAGFNRHQAGAATLKIQAG